MLPVSPQSRQVRAVVAITVVKVKITGRYRRIQTTDRDKFMKRFDKTIGVHAEKVLIRKRNGIDQVGIHSN